jgi:hypothetical protein
MRWGPNQWAAGVPHHDLLPMPLLADEGKNVIQFSLDTARAETGFRFLATPPVRKATLASADNGIPDSGRPFGSTLDGRSPCRASTMACPPLQLPIEVRQGCVTRL